MALLLAATTLGCGGDAACVPGEQVECACPGGTVGAQACNADGDAFGDCSCDGTNPSAGGSGPALNACEVYAAKVQAKYDECDIPTGGAGEGGAGTCDAEAQMLAPCFEACFDGVTCDVLSGDDLDGLEMYADCVTGCTE